jgi:hypothetical protein
MACPLTADAASEQSHATVSATSSGRISRPSGSVRAMTCYAASIGMFRWRDTLAAARSAMSVAV